MKKSLAYEIKRVIANAVIRELPLETISKEQAVVISDTALRFFDEQLDKKEIFLNLEEFIDRYEIFAADMYGIKLEDFAD